MGQIRDIMEKNVITIENDKTAQDAAKIIAEKDISFLVVMNEGLPEGVLSESDFVRKIAAEDKKSSNVPISEIIGLFAAITPARNLSPYEKPPGNTTASIFFGKFFSCQKNSVLRLKTSVNT